MSETPPDEIDDIESEAEFWEWSRQELPDGLREEAAFVDETSGREMASTPQGVPQNAISIADPSEAPPGAQVVQGPQGGYYYVPAPGGATPDEPGAPDEGQPDVDEPGGGQPGADEDTVETAPNPDEDVPRFTESPEMESAIEDLHAEPYVNGFTLNADLTEYDGQGYVATITSDTYTHPEAGGEGITKDDIVDLYQRMQPILSEFPVVAKLGTFYGDDGYMSVDLNIVTDDKELATMIGEENNQQAIWDMNEGKPISTGGEGESPLDPNDPEGILSFIRDVVENGREASVLRDTARKYLATVAPDTQDGMETTYVTNDGTEVPAAVLFGKIKSGAWTVTDTKDPEDETGEVWAIETRDGERFTLTPQDDAPERADGGRAAAADTDHDSDAFVSPFAQTPATYTDEEDVFHRMYVDVLWDQEARERNLYAGQRMPESVRERLIEGLREGALFASFTEMNDNQRAALREFLIDRGRGDGWTVSELAEQLKDIKPSLTQYDAERIARTETQSIVTHARQRWYEGSSTFTSDETRFIWQGPQDHRTTEACTWLKEQANPQYGGEPRTLDELEALVAEASDRFFPELDHCRWTVHPYERHTIVRFYDVT